MNLSSDDELSRDDDDCYNDNNQPSSNNYKPFSISDNIDDYKENNINLIGNNDVIDID